MSPPIFTQGHAVLRPLTQPLDKNPGSYLISPHTCRLLICVLCNAAFLQKVDLFEELYSARPYVHSLPKA